MKFSDLVNNSANQIGKLQVGVNKILWGNGNKQPIQNVKYNPASGSLQYTTSIPTTPQAPTGSLVSSGLFNALDTLNQVDLCNVVTYLTDNINLKKTPRPDKGSWNESQKKFYGLQDRAKEAVSYLDKYTAYPNVFIGSYVGLGPNAQRIPQAVSQSNAPAQGGTDVTKYNLYFLMKSIQEVFSFNTPGTGSLFTAEDKAILTSIPGLASNIAIINDFSGIVNRYSDYRQIPDANLQSLQNKVTTLRSVCITVQNLDFRSSLALTGNFLGTDIRSQIQQISKFIDPTKIIPTLKEINSTVRAFIRITQQVQGILSLGQFLIKLGLLFYKVFKFIIAFFGILPIPNIQTTAGLQTKIQDAKDKAKDESDGIMRVLKSINALLSVLTVFIRYLLANTNELLIRLERLLITLQGCEATKDSEVVSQLQTTVNTLKEVQNQLATYVIKYDTKTNQTTTTFGNYEIKVLEEQVIDPTSSYRRRKGVALGQRGELVVSTDLTFATNLEVIIGEVKQKLVSMKLVLPALGAIDATNLSTISESITYLNTDDVLQDDLNISDIDQAIENALTDNEGNGLGLGDFVNNLPGGRKLRKRVQTAVSAATANLSSQLSQEKTNSTSLLKNK